MRIAELEAEVIRLREALVEAAERIEQDGDQIHSEWGVGPYKADPYIEELRALARGEVPSAVCVCDEINTRHCPVHGQGDT